MEADSNWKFDPQPLLPPEYEIENRLGKGAAGQVFKAKFKFTGEFVAIKFFRQDEKTDEGDLERLRQEIKAISILDHPNIVKALHVGIAKDKTPFLVYEFLEGETLGQVISAHGKQPLEKQFLSVVIAQICEALEFAHSKGVIHRDVKPANIMIVDRLGSFMRVKLLDFGIAKIHNENSPMLDYNTKSVSGKITGTPHYMSPEQAKGIKVDARSDVYALACVVYESLTGKVPFEGETPFEILYKQINENPPLPNRSFSKGVNQLLKRALSKIPDERHASIQEFNTELQQALKQTNNEFSERKSRITSVLLAIICVVILIPFFSKPVREYASPKTATRAASTATPHKTKAPSLRYQIQSQVARATEVERLGTNEQRNKCINEINSLLAKIKSGKNSARFAEEEFVLTDLKGDLSRQLGKVDDAILCCKECVKISKQWAPAGSQSFESLKEFAMLAIDYYRSSSFEKSEEYLQKALNVLARIDAQELTPIEFPFGYRCMFKPHVVSAIHILQCKMCLDKNKLDKALDFAIESERTSNTPWTGSLLSRPFLAHIETLIRMRKLTETKKLLLFYFDQIRNNAIEAKEFNNNPLAPNFDHYDAYSASLEALDLMHKYQLKELEQESLNMMVWLCKNCFTGIDAERFTKENNDRRTAFHLN